MWLFVLFDLPTNTKKERRAASVFRKRLLKGGFTMMQYSVYVRHCASYEAADVHTRRVKAMMPDKGHVSILRVTDKQYSLMDNFWSRIKKPAIHQPLPQLELF
jgi:CRISPR-associated protein Cas2